MLVLSRKIDEEILIGGDIRVMVVEIKANAVRLGITAPSELPVHRREVAEAIRLQELRQCRANADILRPARHQAPFEKLDRTLAAVGDDSHRLRRRDVVARGHTLRK